MKKLIKKTMSLMLVGAIALSGSFLSNKLKPIEVLAQPATSIQSFQGKTPKYIFLFIGDGMSYSQITSASDYLGKIKYGDSKVASDNLNFMSFPVAGTATTFDSTSFAPDSASTATSISTGRKTHSGVINMDEQKKITYETISEKLKKQLGYKIGVVSSVSIDHATPAAFYAHQPSRGNYYEIAVELTKSNFDYFGGGGFLLPTGKNKDQKDITALAKEAGYKIYNTKDSILKLDNKSGKVIATNPVLDSSSALPYSIDATDKSLSLAQFTQKGIDVLKNDKGFFMMIEGGKVDWACHANDAITTIKDTIAFADAVDVAIKFANQYPNDTLILVTGDHETGGMTIGFAATGYSTYFDKLSAQKISYEAFDKKVEDYRNNKISFEEVLKDIKDNFGLITNKDPEATTKSGFVLSDYEYMKLENAYNVSMSKKDSKEYTEEEAILYGGYEPITVTITHILNNKAGLGFTSYSHTGLPVPVFAKGSGAELFDGYYDNTDIFNKLQQITKVK